MKTLSLPSETVRNVRADLTEDRWIHTQGVMDLSRTLAETYSLNGEDLLTAALFHDNARDLTTDEQKELAQRYQGQLDERQEQSPGLLHAPAGAQRMLEQYGFDSDDRLPDMVAAHTTGRPNPSPLLSALLVADFAEPNRSHSRAQTVRSRIGDCSLRTLTRNVLKNKLRFLLNQGRLIHPRSTEAYNSLCE